MGDRDHLAPRLFMPGSGECGCCDRPAVKEGWCRPCYAKYGSHIWSEVGKAKGTTAKAER
jgi:hypothetical protein